MIVVADINCKKHFRRTTTNSGDRETKGRNYARLENVGATNGQSFIEAHIICLLSLEENWIQEKGKKM